MPFLLIGIPLLIVTVLNIFSWRSHRAALWAALAAALYQTGQAGVYLVRCAVNDTVFQSHFFGTLTVDLFGAIVLFLIGMISAITIIVAAGTVKASRFTFGSAVLILMMGMNGVVMVRDIFSLYVFIEAVAAASFLLIAIEKKLDALEGAFKYYLLSAVATTLMLIAIALIFMLVGDTSFEAVRAYLETRSGNHPAVLKTALIFFISALAVKSGVVPFHSWVPDAHSSAPSPVSVMLAGIVIKVSGVYALIRVFRDVFLCDARLGTVLSVLSVVSIIVGALGAIGQNDIKRMLAFSSVSQIGYILLGVSTGSYLGFVGAMMHYFNHATFKSLLFVNATAIIGQTGTRDMSKLGGLSSRMPVTGTSSVLGLLSMAGIPPLSGFWSKLVIVIAVWQVSPALAVIALLSSVITLGYFLVLQKKVFYGKLAPGMDEVTECAPGLRSVEIFLSALNVAAGLLFPLVFTLFKANGLL